MLGFSVCSLANGKPAFVSMDISFSAVAKAQDRVQGQILSQDGQPIVGASITNVQTGSVIQTDGDGRFQLPGAIGQQLRVTMIGYQSKTFAIDTDTIEIRLDASNEMLDEVVVVGYGTQKKVNLTGAVATLQGDELESRPIANLGKGLQGHLPGLTIRSQNTAPGASAPEMRIRGVGTWGDAAPLIVIDGIPGGDINILNPDDIESVSVLKDAASSSIYGVRGANGVILVTTKKGQSGAPSLNFNSYYGWQTPTALPNFLGSVDYMTLQNEANRNAGQGPTYSEEQIGIARDGSDPNYFANTNWIDEVYRKSAPQQNYNLSLQGGMITPVIMHHMVTWAKEDWLSVIILMPVVTMRDFV